MKNSAFLFKDPEQSPGLLLWRVNLLWQRQVKTALKKYSISHTQFVILASLLWFEEKKEPVTQNMVAAQTNLDKMVVSKTLRQLEKAGMLSRAECAGDTRAKSIFLKTGSRPLIKKALKTVERTDERFFSILGPSKLKGLNAQLAILARE